MGANSSIRKTIKKMLRPVLSNGGYKYLQAVSKAWDIKNGSWSDPELDLVSMALKEGETALDLGANFGLYSYAMSRAVGGKGKVYSFEPIPFTYDTLVSVGKILGFKRNVSMVNKGCSNENGTIQFTIPLQDSGALSTGQVHIAGRNDDRAGKEEQVRWNATKTVDAEVVRLDDFLPAIDELPLIKSDIEGAELFAFRGAEKLIDRHLPTVICEINVWFLGGFGIELNDLLNFFFDKGYRVFHYTNDDGQKRLREVGGAEIVEDNYIFIHPKRFERFPNILPN